MFMTFLLHMFMTLLPHMFFCCRTCILLMSSSFDWFEHLWFENSFINSLIVRLLKFFLNRLIQGLTWFEQSSFFLFTAWRGRRRFCVDHTVAIWAVEHLPMKPTQTMTVWILHLYIYISWCPTKKSPNRPGISYLEREREGERERGGRQRDRLG